MALLPYAGTRFVGELIGSLSFLFRSRSAKVTEANIRHCFPRLRDGELKLLVQQSLKHTGRLLAETGITFHWSAEKIERLITSVEGLETAEAALAAKRGVLVLIPHYGNWELLALYFGRLELIALYDPPKIASLDPLIRQSRQRTGATLLPIDAQGVRSVLRALKIGKPVGLLPDQVPTRSAGLYALFFNRPALTMTFAHRLIHNTRPAVFIGSCARVGNGFKITLAEAPENIYSEDVEVSVTALNGAIEKLVRSDPAQYQWEYKRFKKLPEGSSPLYG